MDKKVFIRILIGKEEEDILDLISKKEYKRLEKTFKRIKPVLDRLGRKECTDQDVWDFIRLIERNHCKRCKHTFEKQVAYYDFSRGRGEQVG